jgi:hypothetical protein
VAVRGPRHPSAVARHDAPFIGERAAARGRSATEGDDAQAGAKRALRASSGQASWIDTPLISQRAATCGRSATECGDEHGDVNNALSVELQRQPREPDRPAGTSARLAVARPTEARRAR